jgi:hypothetical protein
MAGKTEVYTWRLSLATKTRLEEAARARERSIAQLLEELVAEGLDQVAADDDETERQRKLHNRVAKHAGTIAGGGQPRSRQVRERVRARLMRRRRRAG